MTGEIQIPEVGSVASVPAVRLRDAGNVISTAMTCRRGSAEAAQCADNLRQMRFQIFGGLEAPLHQEAPLRPAVRFC